MKMSTIAAAVAAVSGGLFRLASASPPSLAASSARTASFRGAIADTAKRRPAVSAFRAGNGGRPDRSGECMDAGRGLQRRSFSPVACFARPSHRPMLRSGGLSPRRFTSDRGEDDDGGLPWTPIRETSLRMSSDDFGTEGFRDAIRYPPQRPQQPPQPRQQPDRQPRKQEQQRQREPSAGIPFPKLSPGRRRNYRPPHVVSALRTNAQINAETQKPTAVDGVPPGPEAEYCDALADPMDRERCVETFREGGEGLRAAARRAEVGVARSPLPRGDGTGGSAVAADEEDYCDALADPADREHCLENFRDGRESAEYMPVRGGAASGAAAGRRPRDAGRADAASSPMHGVVNGDVARPAPRPVDGPGDLSTSEHFRDGPATVSTRSGSDVGFGGIDADVIDLPPNDEGSEGGGGSVRNPMRDRKSRILYEDHDSMNFRDGTRMTTFKDAAFRSESGGPTEDWTEGGEDGEEIGTGREASEDGVIDENDDENTLDSLRNIARQILGNEGSSIPLSTKDTTAEGTTDHTASKAKTTLFSIDPRSIDIVPLKKVKAVEDRGGKADAISPIIRPARSAPAPQSSSFVDTFRGSASYIANHRGTLAVYHIPGELLAWEGFPGLMDDIALTWLLGMRIVIVAGCRHQIDLRLEEGEEDGAGEPSPGGRVMMSSIRVTDEDTLRVVKEEAGFVRFEIERRLARSLRLHGGLVKGSESLVGNVVSGNFYSAQPFGVLDGIDYCWTGFPRKVETDRIRQVHETNDIVLLTSLGVSPSGEIFNVNSEFLAASVAGALSASKIIYFNVHGTSFQNKLTGKSVQNLRASDARNLLAHYKMRIHPKGFAQVDLDGDSPQQSVLRTPGSMETLIKVGYSMAALEKGVKRAHILAPENGALVQELYTRDGCGTLISRDIYEGIRRADVNDVSGIYDLILPLVQSGTLVERPKSTLEKEILSYYVYTRDGLILATGQLRRFEGGFAEIGCLVVSKDYRRGGRGDAMLGYLERLSLQSGARKVFVLSTQTMEWFVERGFREVAVESLPPSRQAVYNKKRKSKIYMKEINGDRDLDAAELWWSNK